MGYGHYYGKREAEAEADAEADPYFLNGVYGTGIHGVATTYGHHGVVGGVHSTVAAVPAVHTTVAAAVPAVHSVAAVNHVAAVPAVHPVAAVNHVAAVPAVHTTVGGINHGVYGGIYN